MTSFTNDDLYQMLLHRLRKDRRGSISPEEFQTFLRWRNLDYYNKLLKTQGVDKANEESLRPFLIPFERMAVTLDSDTGWYSANTVTGLSSALGQWISAWFTTATWDPAASALDMTTLIEVDMVQEAELPDRLANTITGPSTTHPIGHFTNALLYVHGISAPGSVMLSYYKFPVDPVYDYYIDAYGNITYLAYQAAYVLQAGEVSKDGSTAGSAIVGASVEIEWDDDDALNILDMIVSDVSIALSDSGSYQASLLERKEN